MIYTHLGWGFVVLLAMSFAAWNIIKQRRQQSQIANFGQALGKVVLPEVPEQRLSSTSPLSAEILLEGTQTLRDKLQQARSLLRWLEVDLEPPSLSALAWGQRPHTHQTLRQLRLESQAEAVVLTDDLGAPLDFVGELEYCEEIAVHAALAHRCWGAFERVLKGPVRVLTMELGGRGIHILRLENSPLYLLIASSAEVPWAALGRIALRLGGEPWELGLRSWSPFAGEAQTVSKLPRRVAPNSLIGTYAFPLQAKVTSWLQRYPIEEMSIYDADGILLVGTYTKNIMDFLSMMPTVRCLAQRAWNRHIELDAFSLWAYGVDETALSIRSLGSDPQSPLGFVCASNKEHRSVDALLSALRWHLDAQPTSAQYLAR